MYSNGQPELRKATSQFAFCFQICEALDGTANIVQPRAGPSKPLLENLNLII